MAAAMARSAASSGHALEQEVRDQRSTLTIPLTQVDQFAMTSSDHYAHAIAGGASTSAVHVTNIPLYDLWSFPSQNAAFDSDDDENRGDATFDRTTRVHQSHDFQPGIWSLISDL